MDDNFEDMSNAQLSTACGRKKIYQFGSVRNRGRWYKAEEEKDWKKKEMEQGGDCMEMRSKQYECIPYEMG